MRGEPVKSDDTLPQGPDEVRQACERSLQRTRPPADVSGYETEHFLGAGAYGEVWVARERSTRRLVAIKYYTHRGGLDWSLLSREVEKLSFLFADRYVVQLIDVGWDAEPPYYIMEYLEHGSLAEQIQAGPLPKADAVAMFREVAIGLVHAHGKGVLHCDLKPANVLLDQDFKPRLADFGQSRLSHEQRPSLGTLFYMAPEQADLQAAPDARWDVYALGALGYHLLTGEPPYRNEQRVDYVRQGGELAEQLRRYQQLLRDAPKPIAHRRGGADRALCDILDRCLSIDPRHRYPNPQAVIDALDKRHARIARRPLLLLGVLGPFILTVILVLLSWSATSIAVSDSEALLIRRGLESNRFAARFVAEAVAAQINRRWDTLELTAADDTLRERVRQAIGKPRDSRERIILLESLQRVHQANSSLSAASWSILDHQGLRLARYPHDGSQVEHNFRYRDYFHGRGRDLDPAVPLGEPIEPIQAPHVSRVIRSTTSDKRVIVFTVPIWDHDGEQREVLGVLGLTVELGRFTELRGDESADRLAVLVDMRADEQGRTAIVLEHPALTARLSTAASSEPELYLSEHAPRLAQLHEWAASPEAADQQLASERSVLDDYRDPIGGQPEQRFLAAIDEVEVGHRERNTHELGWFVIVQEDYGAVVNPAWRLGTRLIRSGAWGLGGVLLVTVLLWGVVWFAFQDRPNTPWLRRWQRAVGMGTPPSGSGSGLSSRGHRP